MTPEEIADRVARARRADRRTTVDPYVLALAALADLVHDALAARRNFDRCPTSEFGEASLTLALAERMLSTAVGVADPGREHALLVAARNRIGVARIDAPWWRRIARWIAGRHA